MISREDYWALLQEIDEHGESLTRWEVDFVARLIDAGPPETDYTNKQQEIIQQIHEKRV